MLVMAMAQVFIPTTAATPISVAEATIPEEDQLSPYPKAPPPSPELQHRVFDFNSLLESLSPSKFEGPREFDRRPLDFTTIFTTSHNANKSPDLSEPGSPLLGTIPPSSLGIPDLPGRSPESSPNSHTPPESGIPVPSHSPESSNSYPHSPTLSMPQHPHVHHSSPQQVSRLPNGFSNRYSDPPRPLPDSGINPQESLRFLSRSDEMYSLHPHLPRSFDTAQSSKLSAQPHVCSSSFQDEPIQRRRKISLKRKNDELGFDSNLEFSFEYSYSSSSGDSDWVVVDPSSFPIGKKVCHQDPQNSLSRQRSSSYGPGTMTHSAALRSHPQPQSIANLTNFQQTPSLTATSNVLRTSATITSMTVAPPLTSVSSTDSLQFMDTGDLGTRMDSLDSMDTGDTMNVEMDSLTNSLLSSTLETGCHGNTENFRPPHTQVSPIAAITIQSSTPPGRSHSSGASYSGPSSGPGLSPNTDSRHSFVQQYFSSYHQQYGIGGIPEFSSNPSRFNFSKSL